MILAFLTGFFYEIVCVAWTRSVAAGLAPQAAIVSFIAGILSGAGVEQIAGKRWRAIVFLSLGYAAAAFTTLTWGRRWL